MGWVQPAMAEVNRWTIATALESCDRSCDGLRFCWTENLAACLLEDWSIPVRGEGALAICDMTVESDCYCELYLLDSA